MNSVDYATVDVFTRQRFAGNPLAVIPDARGLTDAQMQSIAAEFNYAESTFVLPPDDPIHTARVRIFTPTDELPFAGHPNVGTGFVLARQGELFGRAVPETMRFEERAGLVEVALIRESGQAVGARITAPRPLDIVHELDIATIASCASLDPSDFLAGGTPPVMASVGLPFALAELVSLEALGRARRNDAAFALADRRYPTPDDRFALFLFHRLSDSQLRARMFAPLSKTPEDPATGSAAAALAARLLSLRPEPDVAMRLVIDQGVEMGRPSQIMLDATKIAGVAQPVQVSGHCVAIMSGSLRL
ncbi:MAG TPA: PhzF family phenazine biosynthesis protein [Stellaceae bacterium]|jgi:trans-2,3-dihydro-3-hydroxyanthranilate isomerase|nr:PhzF family phenazine biosynthesis protein [Stellaceae bacterium]